MLYGIRRDLQAQLSSEGFGMRVLFTSERFNDPGYARALEDLKLLTDTRWSPWRFIDADDQDKAAAAALAAVTEAWNKAMPAEPPHLVRAPTQAA